MESSVCGICVFDSALGAHWELVHGCVGSVIGKPNNRCVSGAAVCAGDEEVSMPSISGGFQLFEAVVADCDIGRDNRTALGSLLAAFFNSEIGQTQFAFRIFDLYII
jgi:hypothetical protein